MRRALPTSALVLATLLVAPAAELEAVKKVKRPKTEDILNIFLGVEYSQWLVGPIYYLASDEERAEFLALRSDDEAEAFIRDFWKRRDPEPEIFGNPIRDLYRERAEIADRRYRERAVLGRRTDRGAIYVIFGEPALIEYDIGRRARDPDLEIWIYPKKTEGLGGLEPQSRYFFAEKEGRTVFHTPRASRRIQVRQ